MEKIKKIFIVFFECLLFVSFLVFFFSMYLYKKMFIFLPPCYIQLIVMSLGVLSILLISRRNMSFGWRIFSMLLSVLLLVESYLMSLYIV